MRRERLRLILGLGRALRGQTLPTEASAGPHPGQLTRCRHATPEARTASESSATEPDRAAALDRDFLEFATRASQGEPDGPAEYHYEYLLVIARKGG